MTVVEAARLEIAKGHVPVAQYRKGKFVKYPKMQGYMSLTLDDPRVRKQGWPDAEGIGVLLGPASKNLAVLDIDDVDFAAAVFAHLARGGQPFRWVWTASGRGHLHIYERTPTEHKETKKCRWEGREFNVELRCKGGLATIPPTPGYTLARDVEPQPFDSINAVWLTIAKSFGVEDLTPTYSHEAWLEEVPGGERNETFFTECRKLAQSGMPIAMAMKHMQIRWEESYQGRMDQKEARDTLASAYRWVAKKRSALAVQSKPEEKTWEG